VFDYYPLFKLLYFLYFVQNLKFHEVTLLNDCVIDNREPILDTDGTPLFDTASRPAAVGI